MATFWVEEGKLYAEGLVPGSIRDSLAKWECIFYLTVAGELVHDGAGPTCALCHEYASDRGDCTGCPVWEHTSLFDCRGTPYGRYSQAWGSGSLAAARSAAEDMMLFLEMLLEESNGT